MKEGDVVILHPWTATALMPNLGVNPTLLLKFELSNVDSDRSRL